MAGEGEEGAAPPLFSRMDWMPWVHQVESDGLPRSCEDGLDRADLVSSRWAASLLVTGAVFGVMAFVLSTGAMFYTRIDYGDQLECFDQRPCASGQRYMPETFSEMVSQTSSPAGKLFQSLGVIASLLLLMSRYPSHLANSNTSQKALCSIVSVRGIVIPIGMLMVAWIPVVPRAKRLPIDTKVAAIHTLGAVFFVVGYILTEIFTLGRLWRVLRRPERLWRGTAVVVMTLFLVGFELCGALFLHADQLHVCCTDQWQSTAVAYQEIYGNVSTPAEKLQLELLEEKYGSQVLIDSATGGALAIKMAEFVCEAGAGLTILWSHLLIWYFCKERGLRVPSLHQPLAEGVALTGTTAAAASTGDVCLS